MTSTPSDRDRPTTTIDRPWRGWRGVVVSVGVAALVVTDLASARATTLAERGPLPPPSAARAASLPDRIGAAPGIRQLITVSGSGWDSLDGTLKAWRRTSSGGWALAHDPVRVVIGYNGWVVADERKQSTGTTPAGRFTLPYAFGRLPNPGARLGYRRVDGNDWWPYEPRDPATYNVYQFHKAKKTHWRADKSEHLDDYTTQYGYAMVIGFNLPKGIHFSERRNQWVAEQRADTRRGGGIFLHVKGDGYTAGCVAMRRAEMRWLVRWVRPGSHPRIVMGPHAYIVRL